MNRHGVDDEKVIFTSSLCPIHAKISHVLGKCLHVSIDDVPFQGLSKSRPNLQPPIVNHSQPSLSRLTSRDVMNLTPFRR